MLKLNWNIFINRLRPDFNKCVWMFFQETCKKLHALIDKIDEERYDLLAKVGKADKEVLILTHHHFPNKAFSLFL